MNAWLVAAIRELELASHDRILDDEGAASAAAPVASGLADEIAARIAADLLKADIAYVDAEIATEATARSNADDLKADITYVDTAISTEASARSAADALLAPLASPVFTGDPEAPTQSPGDNSTKLATTEYADEAVAAAMKFGLVEKTTSETLSLNSTLTDDSDLQVAMAANTTYMFRISLAFSYITGGYQYGITGPSSPTAVRWGASNAYGLIGSGGTNGQQIVFMAVKVENGANAGNFKIQFAQASGAAGSITMEKGSYIEYRALP